MVLDNLVSGLIGNEDVKKGVLLVAASAGDLEHSKFYRLLPPFPVCEVLNLYCLMDYCIAHST
jgi:hypothetical protein